MNINQIISVCLLVLCMSGCARNMAANQPNTAMPNTNTTTTSNTINNSYNTNNNNQPQRHPLLGAAVAGTLVGTSAFGYRWVNDPKFAASVMKNMLQCKGCWIIKK